MHHKTQEIIMALIGMPGLIQKHGVYKRYVIIQNQIDQST